MLLVMLDPKFDIWLDSSIDPSIHYPKFFARLILQPILVKRHIFALIFHCKNGSIWVKMVAIMWKGKHLGIQFSNNFSSPIEYEYPFASNNRTTNIGWLYHPNLLTVNLPTYPSTPKLNLIWRLPLKDSFIAHVRRYIHRRAL